MLKIEHLPKITINNCAFRNSNNIVNIKTDNNRTLDFKSLDALNNYNKINVSFKSAKTLQRTAIGQLKIGNLKFIENNGLRGETLSSKRHKRFLPVLKEYGVDSIIDLRDKFTNENYEEMCKEAGLKYYHIPIDSFKIDTSKIIEKMPQLFEIMDNKNYYMACALGLHRTDIAQTINYLFNPTPHKVPIMYGHQRSGIFKRDDIMRRIGSIKKEITEEQIKKLGWKNNFEEEFKTRKEEYVKLNTELAQKQHQIDIQGTH